MAFGRQRRSQTFDELVLGGVIQRSELHTLGVLFTRGLDVERAKQHPRLVCNNSCQDGGDTVDCVIVVKPQLLDCVFM